MARKINPMNTRTNKELLLGHAILHRWWRNPKSTFWTKKQIRDEHTRLVKIILKRGFNHNSPLLEKNYNLRRAKTFSKRIRR